MANLLDSLSDMATGLDSGGIFQAFNTGVLARVYFFLRVAFWMGVVLVGGAMIYKFYLQYKIKLTIFKPIGTSGSVEQVNDMAKVVTDTQNKTKLVLYKTRKGKKQPCTLPIPEAKYKGKKGKMDHYNLWMDDNMELHPILPPIVENNFEKLEVRPQERSAWGRMEDEILFKKYQKKDALLKYATPAILMTACITAFLIFFFASKEVGGGLSELAGTFRQIAASCTKLG